MTFSAFASIVKGHFCSVLLSNIPGYLRFCRLNNLLTGSGFHCPFLFFPLLFRLLSALQWISDCLLSSAYFFAFGCLRISGYFFDLLGIVLIRLMLSEPLGISFPFFLALFSGMPIDSIVLLQSMMPFTGCPVYERILPVDSCFPVFFAACAQVSDFPLFFTRKLYSLSHYLHFPLVRL